MEIDHTIANYSPTNIYVINKINLKSRSEVTAAEVDFLSLLLLLIRFSERVELI